MSECRPPTAYLLAPQKADAVAWLLAHGYIADGSTLGIAWSTRSGIDFTSLIFYALNRREGDTGWSAVVGNHASGENPRMPIGTCENLAEVQEVHDLIRRLNGFEGPEAERGPVTKPPSEPPEKS